MTARNRGRPVRAATTKRARKSSRARFVRSALKTLESLSCGDLANRRNAENYLSIPELEALTQAMRFVTIETRTRAKLPRALNFEGVQLRLSYSNFGRVFIVSRRTGRVLASSGFGAQW